MSLASPNKYHGKTSVFKLASASSASVSDVSAYLNDIKFTRKVVRDKTKSFGDLGERYGTRGLYDDQFSIKGFWAPSASTKIHGKTAQMCVAQYHVSKSLNKLKVSRKIPFAKNPTLGDTGLRYGTVPPMDASVGGGGFTDYAASAIDALFRTWKNLDPGNGDTLPIASIGPNGFAIGASVEMIRGLAVTDYSVSTAEEKDVMFDFSANVDDVLDFGVSLHDDAAADTTAGTVNYTSVNESASSAITPACSYAGAIAMIFVSAFAGTSCTIKVQHSSDDITYADLGAFASITGVTSERISIAAGTTINQYVRAAVTAASSLTSITHHVAWARRGYQYGTAGTARHFCGIMGGYIYLVGTATGQAGAVTPFEFYDIGTTTGNPKKTGNCRLSSFDYDLDEEKDVEFNATFLVDGTTTDTTA